MGKDPRITTGSPCFSMLYAEGSRSMQRVRQRCSRRAWSSCAFVPDKDGETTESLTIEVTTQPTLFLLIIDSTRGRLNASLKSSANARTSSPVEACACKSSVASSTSPNLGSDAHARSM
eukprot:5075707-Amphidinium_carterae.1